MRKKLPGHSSAVNCKLENVGRKYAGISFRNIKFLGQNDYIFYFLTFFASWSLTGEKNRIFFQFNIKNIGICFIVEIN